MILFIDKPLWFTSFWLIKKLKRIWQWEKIWHAWTLDPNASWLMIVAIGKDTKRLQSFIWLDKSYETVIDFSQRSDTRDTDKQNWITKVTESNWERSSLSEKDIALAQKRWRDTTIPRKIPTQEEIKTLCDSLLWTTEIPLTPFSAKKVNGKKLYEYARKGEPIHKNVPMNVIAYEILDYSFPHLKISFSVWSWTYIRSLAYVIGSHFGWGWILTQLRRTRIGKYTIEQLQ